MSKYSKEVILNYINGLDIDYDIDELENDPKFMLLVIKNSKDKNFYKLCSDDVKKDYELVKYLIDTFSDDKKFVIEVSDFFLENTDELSEKMSISLKLKELFKDEEEWGVYAIMSNYYLFEEDMAKEMFLKEEEKKGDYKVRDRFGKGFYSDKIHFSCDEANLKYIAETRLNEIFCDFNLEQYLHKNFKKFTDIEKVGLNKMLISIIGNYDEDLGDYVATHLDVLNELSKELERIKNNWDFYNYQEEKDMFEYITNETREYLSYDGFNLAASAEEILYYFAKKYGLEDKMFSYIFDEELVGLLSESMNPNDENYIESNTHFDPKELSLKDRKLLKGVQKIFEDGLSKNYIDGYIKETEKEKKLKENKKNAQVLEFKRKTN